MRKKIDKMSPQENLAQMAFKESLQTAYRQTHQFYAGQVIVAMVGLVGSGKSAVANEIARLIKATVISADEIRVELRKQNAPFEGARKIAENIALDLANRYSNIVINSDFIDPAKRASLIDKALKAKIKLVFVRTYCDFDTAVGRILSEPTGEFFEGASSKWIGDKKGAVVKIRELWRRTPHHYRWVNKIGGQWILKKLPFKVAVEIDTTNEQEWKTKIRNFSQSLF